MSWLVRVHPETEKELEALPTQERQAVQHAIEKLELLGPSLGHPHSSAVRNADRLRELRPRSGRSRWRVVYRRIGEVFVLAALAPEADVDRQGFNRAIRAAEERLSDLEEVP